MSKSSVQSLFFPIGRWFALGALLAWPSVAHAWVETTLKSDNVWLEVDSSGMAKVRHEMWVRVRGGPLKEFVVDGVDADASPLPDASLVRAKSGAGAGHPIPLVPELDGTVLRLVINAKKGVSRGTFLFRFTYETNLANLGGISDRGGHAELQWTGPRFDQGLDSAKLVLSLPRAASAPSIPAANGADGRNEGVFLAQLRRSSERDTLEIVRPHVARGETVTWRAKVDPELFGFAPAVAPTPTPHLRSGVSRRAAMGEPSWRRLGALGASALVLAVMLWVKGRSVAVAAEQRGASARPLVRLPLWARALIGAWLAFAGGAVALELQLPALGAGLAVLYLLLASHLEPRLHPRLRGPGEWARQDPACLAQKSSIRSPGAWLDMGRWQGFLFFFAQAAGLLGLARIRFAVSPYEGIICGMGIALLLPIFCTGRATELPTEPGAGGLGLLRKCWQRVEGSEEVEAELLGRVSEAGAVPDELRIRLSPQRVHNGFQGIELAVENQMNGVGRVPLPVIILRVREGSACHQVLSKRLAWARGRTSEQRACLLRPALPDVESTIELLGRILDLVQDETSAGSGPRAVGAARSASRPQSASNSSMSAGSSSSQVNPASA